MFLVDKGLFELGWKTCSPVYYSERLIIKSSSAFTGHKNYFSLPLLKHSMCKCQLFRSTTQLVTVMACTFFSLFHYNCSNYAVLSLYIAWSKLVSVFEILFCPTKNLSNSWAHNNTWTVFIGSFRTLTSSLKQFITYDMVASVFVELHYSALILHIPISTFRHLPHLYTAHYVFHLGLGLF